VADPASPPSPDITHATIKSVTHPKTRKLEQAPGKQSRCNILKLRDFAPRRTSSKVQPMTTTPYESRFTSKVELVKKWSAEHGDCNIPVSAVIESQGNTIHIGRWVDYIRGQYRAGRLPDERIQVLEAIPGWTWKPRPRGPIANTHKVRDSQIRELRREGITLEAIAYSFGLSKQRIAQICAES
jgi:Helicase associated domain